MNKLDEAIKACERVSNDCTKYHLEGCTLYENNLNLANWLKELKAYRTLESEGMLVRVPCSKGTRLYRVTYPYRQNPKVTEYEVRNFRTVGKKQSLQLEVRVVSTNLTNWMYYDDFYKTREEAEEQLRKEQKCEK